MTPRIANPAKFAPAVIKAMVAMEDSFAQSNLDPVLMELVRLRASQINGCAYCIHMHATELRNLGETEMRLHMLNAWRESSLYSEQERAALGWTEALTRLAGNHPTDAEYNALQSSFGAEEQVQLTLLIGAINAWNRLRVGFRLGHPNPEQQEKADESRLVRAQGRSAGRPHGQ
jgi:AhpD family alkylhydroperoxidase